MLWRRRPHFDHLHPPVLGKMRGHDFVGIFHFTARRNRNRPRHLHHGIRRRNIPAVSPQVWPGRPARVSRRSTSFIPIRNRGDLSSGQRRIIRKFSIPRIGKPGWHHLHLHRSRNLSRQWPSLFISHQRHGRRLTGAMATLAMILKNRKNVFIKSRRRRLFRSLERQVSRSNKESRDHKKKNT